MPGEGSKGATGPRAEIVVAQLDKVLGSRTFSRAESLGRLLRYLVEETVAGRSAGLKEVTIGVEALGRGSSFDPDADPIVRVQARRLRQKLEAYYRGEGLTDAIVIGLPKGAYIPTFAERAARFVEPKKSNRLRRFRPSPRRRACAWLILQGTRKIGIRGGSCQISIHRGPSF